jgi:hypothetical protein
MVAFFFSRAGRRWGLDARIAAGGKSWLARRPFT